MSPSMLPSPSSLPSPRQNELYRAIVDANLAMVKIILSQSPQKINEHFVPAIVSKDFNGKGLTPLMLALRCGLVSVSKLLIEKKADVNLQDQFGKTAAMHAVEFGHGELPIVCEIAAMAHHNAELTDHWGQALLGVAAVAGSAHIRSNATLIPRFTG